MKTATVGNLTYTMRYNQDGIRTGKVQSAGGTTGEQTAYFVEDGEILGEYRYGAGTKKLLYQFDANGRRIGFTYNGTQCYYRRNLQGDVIAIVDRNADTVAKYTYDPWGKVLSVTNASGVAQASSSFIGNINPIRYRGYYYDTDLELYYLQSRYYDPETGRFVNGDAYAQTGTGLLDKNMFAYCLDDPVNLVDETGESTRRFPALTVRAELQLIHDDFAQSLSDISNGASESIDPSVHIRMATKRNHFVPRKDQRKGSQNRQPTGERERNVAHPNGEEHSRVAKGNRGRKLEINGVSEALPTMDPSVVVGIGMVTVGVVALVWLAGNDATGVGMVDDVCIAPVLVFIGEGVGYIAG